MNLQVIKNRIKNVLAYGITSILFLIISGFLILQLPPVQNRILKFYLKDFSEVTGFTSSIKTFRMLWFDRLELQGVTVFDPVGNKMISANEIMINFKFSHLLEGNDINVDGVYLDSTHVYLTKIDDADTARDLNINVFIARINQNFSGGGGGGKTPRVNIGEAFINQSQFTYVDQDKDSIEQGFNYNQFSLAIDETQLESFVVLGDTIEFDLRTLIAQDLDTKFEIKQLSTFYRISQQTMEFVGLDLKAGNSVISDTVIFSYKSQRDLNDFVNKVKIHAYLDNTLIDPEDLAHFAPGIERVGQPIRLRGEFNGRVNKFKVTNMDLKLGSTRLAGSLDMDGVPNINETFIILNLNDSEVDPEDLAFLFDENVMGRLRPMGRLHMDGQFLGYPTDFVANGNFRGRLGAIKSDINFKVNEENFNRSEYSGKLKLTSFDLGTYLNDTSVFDKITLDGKISGSGLTQKTADFSLNGRIIAFDLKGYEYKNIITDARFASGLFHGNMDINDPNLELKAVGSIDLRDGKNQIRVRAQLDTVNLHKLNLSRDEIFIQTTLNADITGLSLDSLVGTADFQDLSVRYKDQSLSLDSIHLDAQKDLLTRSLLFQSTLADATIKGSYNFSSLLRDIQILTEEITLNIKNDQHQIRDYYARKTYRPKTYEADISIILKDIEPVAKLLGVDLMLSPNTTFEGRFTSGPTTILTGYTAFDSLVYAGKIFLNTEAELTASKITDSTSVLAMATISSERQTLGENFQTKNLLVEGIWNKSHIDFGLDADQEGQNNYVRLKGAVDFLKDSTVFSMDPSALKLLERDWTFSDGNYISIKGTDWTFKNLALLYGQQSVNVNGKLSKDPSEILTLNIQQLDLSILDVLTNKKFAGIMDARIDLSNYYRQPSLQNSIIVKDFSINDFLVGDITGKNLWDTTEQKFNINLFVDREQNRFVDVLGSYTPSDQESPLNITAKLEEANLNLVEPFLADIFSHIGGTVSGEFKIKGHPEAPDIHGEGLVKDGQLMVNYLKTMYRFTGKIGLTESSIYFRQILLNDAFRNTASLNGAILHDGFANMTINLDATFNNFQVLNTSAKDNSLFYGQAYTSGDLNFFGPLSNLRISSTARTEKNTRIYIPLGGSSSIDKKEFISFVDFSDTTFTKKMERDLQKKVNLTGLSFDLNLDVTPDAYCEIIFDQKAGDIIRGRGNGDLKLELNTKGEFYMFGPFEFTQGWYNFTLYDIINKEFEIQKGSRISWYGDPYQATMDINASYNQMASLAPLVNDPNMSGVAQVKRKYPVQVLLKLEGPMLSPLINFDITAKDLPKNIQTESGPVNLDLLFVAFKNKLDEQELKRQVFSLIVLRRFSPPESFNTSGSVVNSVSELLSNQLSYWMSQVDQNLEIDVDLGTMDEESFNTFQLRFSYTFLNGRLRVTGDGTFNNNTSTPTNPNQASPSSVAGDWTVDYMLTADGKLRVKMYSRTNVNPILTTVNNQTAITTGASLIHTQSFDEIRDLWRNTRRKKKEQEMQEFNEDAIKEEDVGQ